MGHNAQRIGGLVPVSLHHRVNINGGIVQAQRVQIRKLPCPGQDQFGGVLSGGIIIKHLALHLDARRSLLLIRSLHLGFHNKTMVFRCTVNPCADLLRHVKGERLPSCGAGALGIQKIVIIAYLIVPVESFYFPRFFHTIEAEFAPALAPPGLLCYLECRRNYFRLGQQGTKIVIYGKISPAV